MERKEGLRGLTLSDYFNTYCFGGELEWRTTSPCCESAMCGCDVDEHVGRGILEEKLDGSWRRCHWLKPTMSRELLRRCSDGLDSTRTSFFSTNARLGISRRNCYELHEKYWAIRVFIHLEFMRRCPLAFHVSVA